MKKNIFHELYRPEAGKKEEEIENKENETKEETQENYENQESENSRYVASSKSHLLCPRCKSERIKHVINKFYGTTPQTYVCENCGYRGSLVLDVAEREKTELDIAMEKDLMKIKKELGL